MSNSFLGEIRPFGFTFAPAHYAYCQGSILAISQFEALFSLLSTNFGGNGVNNFGLPDLRGRAPISHGTGVGLTPRIVGQMGGQEYIYLHSTQCAVASHTHPATLNLAGLDATTDIQVSSTTPGTDANLATAPDANGATLSNSPPTAGASAKIYLKSGTAQNTPVSLGGVTTTVTATGGGVTVDANPGGGSATAPLGLMDPFTVLNFCICTAGLYPQRN